MISLECGARISKLLGGVSDEFDITDNADVAEVLEVLAAVIVGFSAVFFKGVNHEAVAVIIGEVIDKVILHKSWEGLSKDAIVHVSKVDLGKKFSMGFVSSLGDDSVVEVVEI